MDKVLVNWCIILALYRKKTWAMKVGNLKIMPISECQVFKRGIHGIMAAMLTKKYVGFFPSHRASILEDRNSLADVGARGLVGWVKDRVLWWVITINLWQSSRYTFPPTTHRRTSWRDSPFFLAIIEDLFCGKIREKPWEVWKIPVQLLACLHGVDRFSLASEIAGQIWTWIMGI